MGYVQGITSSIQTQLNSLSSSITSINGYFYSSSATKGYYSTTFGFQDKETNDGRSTLVCKKTIAGNGFSTPLSIWATGLRISPNDTNIPTHTFEVNGDVSTSGSINGATPTAMGFLDATSSIQTQLNSKQETFIVRGTTVAYTAHQYDLLFATPSAGLYDVNVANTDTGGITCFKLNTYASTVGVHNIFTETDLHIEYYAGAGGIVSYNDQANNRTLSWCHCKMA